MYVENPFSETKQNLLREVDANPGDESLQRKLEEISAKENAWIQDKLEELGISLRNVRQVAQEIEVNESGMTKTHQYKESLKLWKLARELVKETKKLKDDIRIRNQGGRR
jgi:hypothetical protein